MNNNTYIFEKNSIPNKLQKDIFGLLNKHLNLSNSKQLHIEIPQNTKFGDYSTNIAMSMAKSLKKNPKEIAKDIITQLQDLDYVEKIDIAGPGFINFYIKNDLIEQSLNYTVTNLDTFGTWDTMNGKKVMVEFAQPNTHKPIHIGHLKSAISGPAIYGLYRSMGAKIIKANYFGDVGMHVAKCLWGYKDLTPPQDIDSISTYDKMAFLSKSYVYGSQKFKEDPEAKKEMQQINKTIYKKSDTTLNELYEKTRKWSIDHQSEVFEELGATFDVQYPESTIADIAFDTVEKNKDTIFTKSEGAYIYEGKKEGLTNWVFLTRENLPTYSAKDLGLAIKKFQDFDIDLSVVTTSSEQIDYFKVVIKVLEKIDPKFKGKYKHLPFGWLLIDNKKTSSRQGTSITAIDLIEEIKEKAEKITKENSDYNEVEKVSIAHKIAIASLKFMILSHEFHKNINYEPDKFLSLSGYSAPYILYSRARAKKILTKSNIKDFTQLKANLSNEEEIVLAKSILNFPNTLLQAFTNLSPHILCNYSYEIAVNFNKLYTKHSILDAQTEEQKHTRLLLAYLSDNIIQKTFDILGIETVEKM